MSISYKLIEIGNSSWLKTSSFVNYLYIVNHINDIIFLINNKPTYINIYILGAMSNVLLREGGLNIVLVRLGRGLNYINKKKSYIISGCSVLVSKLYFYSLQNSIYGFQFLHGIPGTIGGMIFMNSGAYKYNISHYLLSTKAINTSSLEIRTFFVDEIFSYRSNKLTCSWIFLEATFKIRLSITYIIHSLYNSILLIRKFSQPSSCRTAGSSFKNLFLFKSWKLLIKSNIVHFYLGNGAMFSSIHANFIFNNYLSNSLDLENLLILSRYIVLKKFRLIISTEIKIIGKYMSGL